MLNDTGRESHKGKGWTGSRPTCTESFRNSSSIHLCYALPKINQRFMQSIVLWKEVGWGTIIFLAALAGVNLNLYEAAVIDGASRLRKMWHITLPTIRSVIVILLILRLGDVLDTATAPILFIYPILQNHFAKGVMLRAIKG